MKRYASPKGWKVAPARFPAPELFISPKGITYKRKTNREKTDAIVQTKYGPVELREWYGCPQEQRTSHHINRKFNKGKHQKKKKKK